METVQPEKKEKKKNKMSKEAINIIRTTQRNNIELTHLADNKANVLLSLNAIMLTFLIPSIIGHTTFIIERLLFIPLIILAATCFTTIYISTVVLRPGSFEKFRDDFSLGQNFSPFFFGNFFKMEPAEFFSYMDETLTDEANLQRHLAQDMYYIGRRLGYKMTWIRRAFSIFLWGIFLSLISTGIVLLAV